MNYRHAFHAGNVADVHKHTLLIALLQALQVKPRPLCYLDTHAGAGRYDLRSAAARRTGEAAAGIGRFPDVIPEPGTPAALRRYLQLVAAEEAGRYPGSPRLAQQLLRADDSAQLCELQEREAATLKTLCAGDHRLHVHRRDGYAALKALLPPRERRGLVLIDPPYEAQEAEFRLVEAALDTALARWPGGVYAVWYPIKLGRELQPFRRWLRNSPARNVLDSELLVTPDDSPLRLNGSGMVILNPPWQLERELVELLPALAARLGPDPHTPAQWRLNWLRRESD